MKPVRITEQNAADIDIELLIILLKDRTTNRNILWASEAYAQNGEKYAADKEILPELITGDNKKLILPRSEKSKEAQNQRTRDNAEVFTPSWICNKQNNLVDAAWFRQKNVFNTEEENRWVSNKNHIPFTNGKTWQDYVLENRLEICCGEAPYLVSRYDTVTGDVIPINERIGLLDRKLRIIGENAAAEDEWIIWAEKAFQTIYGYDIQGDNVLLARTNLLFTFCDYYESRFTISPHPGLLSDIAEIISWNIWQMDGLEMTAPYSKGEPILQNNTLPGIAAKPKKQEYMPVYCRIMDWEKGKTIKFKSLIDNLSR